MNDQQRFTLCHAIVAGWDAQQEHAPHASGHSDLCHLFRRTWTPRRRKGEYAPGFERAGFMSFTDWEIRHKAGLCLEQYRIEGAVGKAVKLLPFDTQKAVADYIAKEEKCFDVHDVTILWGEFTHYGFRPEQGAKVEHTALAVPRNKWEGLEPFPGGFLDDATVASVSRHQWEGIKTHLKRFSEWQRPWFKFAIMSLGHHPSLSTPQS